MMAGNNITNEMKRHAVIVSIKAEHSDLKIPRFLKIARSFVCKVRKELKENNGDELAMSKRKQHCQCSDSLRTLLFKALDRQHSQWKGLCLSAKFGSIP